ncbi:hypothetical protein [uncultured Cohaesibacter sp.]|uniref:hypothetical protein n=1 Tax=uncultured Cohaesibacter sp. TaxID=1002546 RepID=UPI0029C82D64|nr:hypothetical protein [uncultured Cohaesibacter sp.]
MKMIRSSTLVPGLALGALLPLLAACQSTCTGDARFDDYWCARSNLSNGVYQQQTNQLQSIAAQRQYQEANAEANLYAQQGELTRVRAALAAKQNELAAARSNNGPANQIARLEAEVAALRSQVETLMQTQ